MGNIFNVKIFKNGDKLSSVEFDLLETEGLVEPKIV